MNVVAYLKPKLPSPGEERADDLERRRKLGQFFTPANVAQFMWDFLEVLHRGPFARETRVIDPACGDGVFLRVAHERGRVSARSLFGADIDETLADDWRKDSLLKSAHIFLGNGLLDHASAGIREGTFDIAIGNPPFSGTGMSAVLRLLEDNAGEQHREQDLFGAASLKEEPAPARPRLSRAERAELDALVRSLSRYDCWRLGATTEEDDAPEATAENGSSDLLSGLVLNDKRRPTPSDYEKAAHIIARWPADRLLDVSLPEICDAINRIASTAIEVFFTERFVRLAKPGGLIAVIVPESIVASDRMSPLRRWLGGRIELRAVISLPQKVFTGVGANAKTSILFVRRREQDLPDGWWVNYDNHPDAKRVVYMAAPRLDAPNYTLETFLDSVLASARQPERWKAEPSVDDDE